MHGHNHLSAIFVTPFLVAARLGNHRKTMLAQNFDDFPWLQTGYRRLTAPRVRSFLPLLGNLIGAGSNQSVNASLALVTASASVSPAVAQPGISGNTAAQRLASGSNSTNNRNFIIKTITLAPQRGKPTDKTCADAWKRGVKVVKWSERQDLNLPTSVDNQTLRAADTPINTQTPGASLHRGAHGVNGWPRDSSGSSFSSGALHESSQVIEEVERLHIYEVWPKIPPRVRQAIIRLVSEYDEDTD